MIVVPEQEIAGLVTRADAFAAVEKVFASMARGDAVSFPVVREALVMPTRSTGSSRASTARPSTSG